MKIALIAAIGMNHELAVGDALPWQLPDDVKDYRQKIRGHTVLMGRKTFDTVGHPKKDSPTIIITRQMDYRSEGCFVFHTIDDGIAFASQSGEEKLFILGGGEIYKATLPLATDLYLTHVDAEFPRATTFFPPVIWSSWEEQPEETFAFAQSDRNSHAFTIKHYLRKK